ncbi:MAG TPA: putative LPS assembly protein LptD [Vicinamibacterales bacterium]
MIFLPGFHHSRTFHIPGKGTGVSPLTIPIRTAAILFGLAVCGASPAFARQGLPTNVGFIETCKQWTIDQITKNHVKLKGSVECTRGDMQVFAEELEYWTDTHVAVLSGNVTFREKDAQISADRAEFNTETRLGTFYNASGFATVATQTKRSPMGGQEPDVYFYGDTIEKIGSDKYRITHGGFTTCVQPTPRWQITSGSVTLRLDHYAYLKNAVLKAKGVPVFYLPALFYPIKKDDRATGFLLPTYGTSTLRGFTLSNAFFWAINRSQDATFMHDWFSQRGSGMGAEYRYASAPGSSGFIRVYRLSEHESVLQNSDGSQTVLPGSQSYEVRANVNQALGRQWSARGRVDYFTDITVQQTYNTNIYDASSSTRTFGGSISGSAGGLTLNGSYDRTEYFSGVSDTTVNGGTPRVTMSRNERPLFGSPIYFSMNGEYANLLRETRSGDTVSDRGLTRLDVMPTFRVPFTKLRFLTVNSSVAWRGTYWTRSQAPSGDGSVVDEGIGRTYFDFQSRITGPVLNRVWNTPDNGYAEKWKHAVEPFFNIQRVTTANNFDRIVQLDGTDYIFGGTTRLDYGVTNRILAKRSGGGSSAREILSVVVSQTYYSDERASQYDSNYSTSFSGGTPSSFSPISVAVRATPGTQVNGNFRLEYDHSQGAIQSMAADGQVAVSDWLHVTAGFSQRRLTSILNVAPQRDNFVNAAATLKSPANRVGGSYTFNYDIGRSTMLTSRIIGYYNAQCCGFAVEYQTYNFPQANALFPVKSDHRFNFSFTLAGLGTFSNFFGALGGSGMSP